jgi:hypothetical protein
MIGSRLEVLFLPPDLPFILAQNQGKQPEGTNRSWLSKSKK